MKFIKKKLYKNNYVLTDGSVIKVPSLKKKTVQFLTIDNLLNKNIYSYFINKKKTINS